MFLQRDGAPHDSDRSFSQRHHRNHYDRQEQLQQHQQQQLQQHQQQPQWSRKSRGRSRGAFTRERVMLFVNLYIHFFPIIVRCLNKAACSLSSEDPFMFLLPEKELTMCYPLFIHLPLLDHLCCAAHIIVLFL